jgi:oxygen-dependent protoporphyrinogen oxidase
VRPVVIIGGGISGLSTAYYVAKSGLPVTLIERDAVLGGLMQTDVFEGCVVERGPDSFITNKPWARQLIDELGIGDQIIGSNDHLRATYIWKGKRFAKMPEGMKLMVPSKLGPILRSDLIGPADKLKILRERFRRPLKRKSDVSVSKLVEEHFGRDVVEYLAEPLLAGVYGGDPDRLSARSVIPKIVEWEAKVGSLSRAAAAEPESGGGPLFSTLKGGLHDLITALERNTKFERIQGTADKVEKGWRVRVNDEWLDCEQLVIACKPSAVLPSLFPDIEYSSSTVVAVGYRKADIQHPLDGFGFLVPKIERRSVAACTWVGTKFDHRVPPDKVLLRLFVSGNPNDVRDELQQKMGITAEPLFTKVTPWPQSMPQYTVGHADRLKITQEMLGDFPGLHLVGNAYRGVGIPDCIRMAQEVADRVVAHARTPSRQ